MEQDDFKNDDMEETESFAELLEQSFKKPVPLHPGQKVKATIIKITPEWVFLDLGGKSEGYLDRKEVVDKEDRLTVQEGDTIQAYYLSSQNNELRFTTRIGAADAAKAHLQEAWHSGIPVEGMVEKEIKGGFEVKIAGNMRGFCPYSQMGLQRVKEPGEYVGKRLAFKITDYGERGRNVILSHRAVLEEQRREQKEALRAELREGMTVTGTITSIRKFGAFVDIGGLEGLIPISEVGWGRVEDINEFLTVGQEVEVVILKLDWEADRFSFSLKGALPDPWEEVEARYPVGSTHRGKVARMAAFGAFVTLEEGIDGLIHISQLSKGKRIMHPREVLTDGQTVEVKIESLDKAAKRLSLSMAGSDQEEQEKEGEDYRQYTQKPSGAMGTLGDLLKSKGNKKSKK